MISQEIMADLLTGIRSFKGKLPVSNNFYPVNHGISIDKNNILDTQDLLMKVLIKKNFHI